MTYKHNQYVLSFDQNIRHSLYFDEGNFGIYFYINNISYNLHHNKYGLDRLIISPMNDAHYNVSFKDMPLNDLTIELLPNCIEILKGEECIL